jgi:hypothetical protein
MIYVKDENGLQREPKDRKGRNLHPQDLGGRDEGLQDPIPKWIFSSSIEPTPAHFCSPTRSALPASRSWKT